MFRAALALDIWSSISFGYFGSYDFDVHLFRYFDVYLLYKKLNTSTLLQLIYYIKFVKRHKRL